MAGRLLDLGESATALPDALMLDTSVVVPRFLPRLREAGSDLAIRRTRISALLAAMANQGSIPFLAASSFVELIHVALVARYRSDLARIPNPSTGRRFPAWTAFYEPRPDLTRRCARDVEGLRVALDASGITVLQPEDLGRIEGGRRIEQELTRFVRRYRLESGDTAMLLEVRRAGIEGIFCEHPDLHRAGRDFDIYTWR